MSEGKIVIVQGGQYGSEAKGMVAAALAKRLEAKAVVRTGAVNAGHTVYHCGFPRKMQQIPTAAWNGDPNCLIIVGPGALVHPDILAYELELLENWFPMFGQRFYIDFRAGLHTKEHTDLSTLSGRHYAIGATGKGCSEALMRRISERGRGGLLFRDMHESGLYQLADTVAELHATYDRGGTILLEGTQGSLLDLYLGPYPYTTHKPTQAATWVQEAGLSPAMHCEVYLVVRTYPIRVAGNSGPMPREISWVSLAGKINARLHEHGNPPIVKGDSLRQWQEACVEIAKGAGQDWQIEAWPEANRERYSRFVSELHKEAWELLPGPAQQDLAKLFEMTTVTRKLRRIAEWDWAGVKQAIMWNRPKYLVLTFVNYLFPELWGATEYPTDHRELNAHLLEIRKVGGVPVRYISTGPEAHHLLEVPDDV